MTEIIYKRPKKLEINQNIVEDKTNESLLKEKVVIDAGLGVYKRKNSKANK